MYGVSDERMAFAGDLKAELLDVQESLRMRELTPQEALDRVRAIRRKRIMGLVDATKEGE